MTLYVTIETFQGVVENVHAYLSEESANAAEKQWLLEMDIHDDEDRQAKSDGGTEFVIFESELKP